MRPGVVHVHRRTNTSAFSLSVSLCLSLSLFLSLSLSVSLTLSHKIPHTAKSQHTHSAMFPGDPPPHTHTLSHAPRRPPTHTHTHTPSHAPRRPPPTHTHTQPGTQVPPQAPPHTHTHTEPRAYAPRPRPSRLRSVSRDSRPDCRHPQFLTLLWFRRLLRCLPCSSPLSCSYPCSSPLSCSSHCSSPLSCSYPCSSPLSCSYPCSTRVHTHSGFPCSIHVSTPLGSLSILSTSLSTPSPLDVSVPVRSLAVRTPCGTVPLRSTSFSTRVSCRPRPDPHLDLVLGADVRQRNERHDHDARQCEPQRRHAARPTDSSGPRGWIRDARSGSTNASGGITWVTRALSPPEIPMVEFLMSARKTTARHAPNVKTPSRVEGTK